MRGESLPKQVDEQADTLGEGISASSFEDALAEISAALTRVPAGQVSREIERWLRYVVLMLGVDRATIGQISPADGLIYTTHQWSRDGILHTPHKMNTEATLPWLTSKIFAGETVALANIEDAPPEAAKDLEYARQAGCKSNLTVPLKIGGTVVGALAFDAVIQARKWSERTVQRLRLLAEMFGNALEREYAEAEILRLTQEIRKASRAANMGELTASLAHELNQPLGAILSNAQAARRFLTAKKPDLEEVRAAIEEIIRDNSRAVETLRNVRALFQRDRVEMSPLDLRQVLLEAERVLSLEARGKGILIRTDLPPSLPTVVGNRTQLLQVLMNLAANAFDSIDEDERAARIVNLSAQSETRRVRIAVRDFGKGIDPKITPRLFDAFFTTKPKGMGIGLRIARSIVENHGGRLWVTPNSERGATLVFELPVKADEQGDQ
jgi:signal transduction histidine kinase